RALTSIGTGSVNENSSGLIRFAGSSAICDRATPGSAVNESPAAVAFRKRRRLARARIDSGMQFSPLAGRGRRCAMGLAEEFGKLFGDGATELFGIDDGDRAAVVTRDIVTDADRDQFDRGAGLDLLDDVAQMPFQVIAGIDRQRRIVDRRTVRNHHQDLALFGTAQKPLMRPVQRLAVDIFLEQALAHHQAQILARAPPWRIRRLVDDVAEIVEAARVRRLAGGKPGFAGLAAL